MENYHFADTHEDEPVLEQGFSKAQLLSFSTRDIEAWDRREHLVTFEEQDENPNKSQPDKKPNEEGPRPPREEDFPDEEKEDLLSEVSDPNEKD
jgi:hypothetical protein